VVSIFAYAIVQAFAHGCAIPSPRRRAAAAALRWMGYADMINLLAQGYPKVFRHPPMENVPVRAWVLWRNDPAEPAPASAKKRSQSPGDVGADFQVVLLPAMAGTRAGESAVSGEFR